MKYTKLSSSILIDIAQIEALKAIQPPFPAWMQAMGLDLLPSQALKQSFSGNR